MTPTEPFPTPTSRNVSTRWQDAADSHQITITWCVTSLPFLILQSKLTSLVAPGLSVERSSVRCLISTLNRMNAILRLFPTKFVRFIGTSPHHPAKHASFSDPKPPLRKGMYVNLLRSPSGELYTRQVRRPPPKAVKPHIEVSGDFWGSRPCQEWVVHYTPVSKKVKWVPWEAAVASVKTSNNPVRSSDTATRPCCVTRVFTYGMYVHRGHSTEANP